MAEPVEAPPAVAPPLPAALLPRETRPARTHSIGFEAPAQPAVPPLTEPAPAPPVVAESARATDETRVAPPAPVAESQSLGAVEEHATPLVPQPPTAAERLRITPPDVVEEPAPQETLYEVCHVGVWRGYAKSRFFALLDTAEEHDLAVAESPLFRFRGNGALERREAIEVAHRALVERLLAEGWELEDTAGPWYASRLRRKLAVGRQPTA